MGSHTRKLLSVITETAIEDTLLADIEKMGAHGYTVTDVRGKGSRGVRNAAWDASSNIRVEVVCDSDVAGAIIAHLRKVYYDDYAMIVWCHDVEVLRPEKF